MPNTSVFFRNEMLKLYILEVCQPLFIKLFYTAEQNWYIPKELQVFTLTASIFLLKTCGGAILHKKYSMVKLRQHD